MDASAISFLYVVKSTCVVSTICVRLVYLRSRKI